jgi:hypothetical protein
MGIQDQIREGAVTWKRTRNVEDIDQLRSKDETYLQECVQLQGAYNVPRGTGDVIRRVANPCCTYGDPSTTGEFKDELAL